MIELIQTAKSECVSCNFKPAIRISATYESTAGDASSSLHLCTMCLAELVAQAVKLQAGALARLLSEDQP